MNKSPVLFFLSLFFKIITNKQCATLGLVSGIIFWDKFGMGVSMKSSLSSPSSHECLSLKKKKKLGDVSVA